jgi:glucokinase
MSTSIVGVDVGGTSIRAVRFDGDLTPAATVVVPTPRGSDAVAAAVADAARAADGGLAALAVGIPGRVDPATGIVGRAVNLEIDRPVAIGALIATHAGVPVYVENDVNAASLGAFTHLRLAAPASLAYLNIGTGIAAGYVLGGRLWRGATGAAGEIGHIPMWAGGAHCACGQVGCAEAMASGRAVDLDPSRRALVADVVGWAVQLCAMTLDVDVVAVGGGMTEATGFHADLLAALATRAAESPMVADLDLAGRIAIVPSDVAIGSIGAVLARTERLGRA